HVQDRAGRRYRCERGKRMTQVLGAFIVILGVVLAVLGTISTFHQSRWFGRAVFLVAALIVGVQSWQTIAAYVEEQRIRSRLTEAVWWRMSCGGWVVLFTFLPVVVGVLQGWSLYETYKSNRGVERAYVGVSLSPPGLRALDPHAPVAQVNVRAVNNGNTPAKV